MSTPRPIKSVRVVQTWCLFSISDRIGHYSGRQSKEALRIYHSALPYLSVACHVPQTQLHLQCSGLVPYRRRPRLTSAVVATALQNNQSVVCRQDSLLHCDRRVVCRISQRFASLDRSQSAAMILGAFASIRVVQTTRLSHDVIVIGKSELRYTHVVRSTTR